MWPIDKLLNLLPSIRVPLGFNNRDVIHSYGSLADVKSSDSEGVENTPVAYMLADRDGVLGTGSKKHYDRIHERMRELFPEVLDESDYVFDLNHCLNYKGLVPFLKDEDGKAKTKAGVLFAISAFFDMAFEKH